jgi:hypothetical protein
MVLKLTLLLLSGSLAFLSLASAGSTSGVTYVRWGRTTCPAGAVDVYKGYAAGSYFGEVGSGNNILCTPETPQWGNKLDGNQAWTGFLYGVEYQFVGEYEKDGTLFSFANNGGQNLRFHGAPCVVCYQPARTSVMMIPARVNCSVEGWNLEYKGYLVSQDKTRYASEYLCLDDTPETIPGGDGNQLSQEFFPVQARCGSLPCMPYVDYHELSCAVCSL